jgi:glycosyltransferase involved in cell wall biosynthesis
MKINILCNQVFDGWEPTDTRLGGTEESIVKWGEELVKRGHDVTVYRNPRPGYGEEVVNGIHYVPRQFYKGGGDICLNIKSSEVKPIEPTVYLTNETNADMLDLSAYDAVIWPTEWAAQHIRVNNDNVEILPHGYDSSAIYPEQKVPKQCLYASSPDRGLQTLLKAWTVVSKAHPDATLIVTYGAEAPSVPMHNVFFLGNLDDETMNSLYRTSDVWAHPCNGGELFGITGIKAQAAGCVPVIIPTMALSETVRHGFFGDESDYTALLVSILGNEEAREQCRELLAKEHYPDWADTAEMLEKILLKYAQK